MRVDKWLWQARFFKTRGLAGALAASGRLRINGRHCTKPAQPVGPGDELSFPQGPRVRAIRVEALGTRRGPAGEAAGLYTDLDPAPQRPAPGTTAPPVDDSPAGTAAPVTATPPRPVRGEGRPTKKARRTLERVSRGGEET
ncbi:MAG: RNA-binding S4 domain-containing protein [Pseudomonadota bacterium]